MILHFQRQTGCFAPLPEISKMWLLRWKRDKGVVLRKPNCRFKCSREVLLRRLRAMWINLYKIRHLASCLLGNDLGASIYGIDEKPLHMNEGGVQKHRDPRGGRRTSCPIEAKSRADARAREPHDVSHLEPCHCRLACAHALGAALQGEDKQANREPCASLGYACVAPVRRKGIVP